MELTPGGSIPRSPAMVGKKVPTKHRVHLIDGRIVQGEIFRAPKSRLADYLSTLKGFLSVVNAVIEESGKTLDFIAINMSNVLMIEEISADEVDGNPTESGSP